MSSVNVAHCAEGITLRQAALIAGIAAVIRAQHEKVLGKR